MKSTSTSYQQHCGHLFLINPSWSSTTHKKGYGPCANNVSSFTTTCAYTQYVS